ncbi:MAG: S46 family peptidase [Gemmatimonadetes bacterium]|nr:S46 family peptidase [Gemmatimonadota bacterium]
MPRLKTLPAPILLSILLASAIPAAGQDYQAGRFDSGKMWTFEYAPAAYFSETYDFDANEAWFERARMAAVRIPGCSASFVSPNGLLATNHHCVRGRVSQVSRPGEGLLDNGFYASSLEEERPIPGYYVDQLLAVEDVTDEVYHVLEGAEVGAERDAARREVFREIRGRLSARQASAGQNIRVQMIALYNGGRYSAYVFRRFTDIRLVFAVELEIGFFGGDPDNFTYPRYALDFAFLRVYEDGEPYHTDHYFTWGVDGVEAGDVVFVIGNPGRTNRLNTMAQLALQRDMTLGNTHAWYTSRLNAIWEFYAEDPVTGEALDLRNWAFGLSNSLKATTGRLEALDNPLILAKRADAEAALSDSIAAGDDLRERYGEVMDRIAAIQEQKYTLAVPHGAFAGFGNRRYGSATLLRAVAAYDYLAALERGAPGDSIARFRSRLLGIGDLPPGLERRYLSARLADIGRAYGPDSPLTRAALPDGTPAASAAALMGSSVMADSASVADAVAGESLSADDPAVRLAAVLLPVYREFQAEWGPLSAEDRTLAGDLGRARFAVYGESIPPDGSRSPRIADGVVKSYEYNGTLAPPYTTFYGLYDRYHAHKGSVDWALPERWQTPPPGLDLGTPLNFVSTADTYGGNSGSPAVTPELELVGINFDRNINGLSRDFIYLPEQGRNVMVDVRAIRAALEHVYGADRILEELGVVVGN